MQMRTWRRTVLIDRCELLLVSAKRHTWCKHSTIRAVKMVRVGANSTVDKVLPARDLSCLSSESDTYLICLKRLRCGLRFCSPHNVVLPTL